MSEFKTQFDNLGFRIELLKSELHDIRKHCLPLDEMQQVEHISAAHILEMDDNIILAYRHLEDARMRLGKAIQAFDGGVSIYQK